MKLQYIKFCNYNRPQAKNRGITNIRGDNLTLKLKTLVLVKTLISVVICNPYYGVPTFIDNFPYSNLGCDNITPTKPPQTNNPTTNPTQKNPLHDKPALRQAHPSDQPTKFME